MFDFDPAAYPDNNDLSQGYEDHPNTVFILDEIIASDQYLTTILRRDQNIDIAQFVMRTRIRELGPKSTGSLFWSSLQRHST